MEHRPTRGGGVDMTRNAEDAQGQRHKLQTTYEDDIYQIPSMVPTTQQTEDKQQADTITNLVIIRRHILDMNGLTLPSKNKANGDGTTSAGYPSPKCCFPQRRSMVLPRRQDSMTLTTVDMTPMRPGVEAAPAIEPPPTATLPLVHPSRKKRHTSH